MSAQTVYSPEVELDTAISALFADKFSALDQTTPQTFQKPRARVEVMSNLGASRNKHLAKQEDTGLEIDVEDDWGISIELELITEAAIDIHDSCRALVRYNMARLPALINGTTLFNHVLYGPMRHTGSRMQEEPDKGFYKTTMGYACDISVHADAWAKINQP